MFETIRIANRAEQAPAGAVAAGPAHGAAAGRQGEFAAGETHV